MIDLLAQADGPTYQAQAVFLMSIAKPILLLVTLALWAYLVGRLDKDAAYYYLKRNQWSVAHIGAGILGFGLLLMVPIFWIGWPVAMIILAGEAFGYMSYRNAHVPADARWSAADIVKAVQGKLKEKEDERAKNKATIKLLDKSEAPLDVPHGSDPRTPAFELFSSMIAFAVPRGADMIDITIDSEKASFIARIDGVRYSQEAPEPQLCLQLNEYLKEHAGMDLEDRRRKQTGKMWVELENGSKHTLSLATSGSTRAVTLSIEIDPDGRLDVPTEHLGLLAPQRQRVEELLASEGKVVIFASPPSCGTTTSMYAFLQKHDPYTSSVMTYEKKVAFEVEGVSHNIHTEGASNEQLLSQFAALLRADPEVMMVSNLMNSDMAEIIAKTAEDTRFYLPIPAKNTLSALKMWIKVVGDTRLAAGSLGAIVSQRLVRRLCHTCRAPYQPDAAALKKLNVPANQVNQLYKGSGKVVVKDREMPCPDCHGLKYRGRVAVFEIMTIDKQAEGYIASGEGERLRAHLRKNRMVYLQEAALAKVVEGISDIKEVTRVMGEKG